MTSRRARSRTPEHLHPGGIPADGVLACLLADAAAPAQPHELDGLSAALTAFSASQSEPRRSPVKTLLASLLAAKGLAAAATVASISGVALATATGSLPPAAQNAAHNFVGAPAPAASHSVQVDDETEPTSVPSPKATPTPSLVGLCRAYNAGVANSKGKALDNPAFSVLIVAAGSEDAVATYCTGLLASAPGGKPTALPTQAQGHTPAGGPPSAHPSGPPSTHPSGPPSAHPSGPPSTPPTGPPSTPPTGPPATHPTGPPATHPTGNPAD